MATRPYVPRSVSLKEKLDLLSESRVPGRCQLWLGWTQPGGYGGLKWRGRNIRAHRATWEVERGPIPQGFDVLHTCDTPACRNIEHLFLGTDADNNADMVSKGRGVYVRGENHGNAILTDEAVIEIRTIPHSIPLLIVAEIYGVSISTISNIRRRKSWVHL